MKGFQIIKSLGKRKLTTCIMILQLTLCIICFLVLCQFINYYNTRHKIYSKIIDEGHTIVVDSSTFDKDVKRKKHTLDEIFKLKDSGILSDALIVSKMNDPFKVNGKFYSCYQLTDNLFKKLDISIDKGRNFTVEEFKDTTNSEEIPVIVGSQLGKYLRVGDTISNKYNYSDDNGEYSYERTLRVIGIATPGTVPTFGASPSIAGIFINDYAIYAPLRTWKYYLKDKSVDKFLINKTIINNNAYGIKYELQGDLIISYQSDYFDALLNNDFQLLVEPNRDTEAVTEIVNDICKKNNSSIRFETLKNSNEIMNELFIQGMFAIITFTIILFTFSIAGIIGTTLYSINLRRKEFGIRISQGATLNEISYLVLGEILFKNITALILAIIPFKFLELYVNKHLGTVVEYTYLVNMDSKILLIVFGLFLFSTLITSIIPIGRIIKLNVVDLFRGR